MSSSTTTATTSACAITASIAYTAFISPFIYL